MFVLSVFAMVSNGVDRCEVAQCRFDDGCWRPPNKLEMHLNFGKRVLTRSCWSRVNRVQQLTAEQIGNVPPRDDVRYSATATGTTEAKPVGDGGARLPSVEVSSWPEAGDTTRHDEVE